MPFTSIRATPRLGVGNRFLRQLKQVAAKAVDSKQQVVVYVKSRVFVIFPNKEVDVGTMNPGDELVIREVWGPQGRDWRAFIEHSSDKTQRSAAPDQLLSSGPRG